MAAPYIQVMAILTLLCGIILGLIIDAAVVASYKISLVELISNKLRPKR